VKGSRIQAILLQTAGWINLETGFK